ncbi:hypothetical protein VTI28DRAFT_8484 [Corynascus sepedonium]
MLLHVKKHRWVAICLDPADLNTTRPRVLLLGHLTRGALTCTLLGQIAAHNRRLARPQICPGNPGRVRSRSKARSRPVWTCTTNPFQTIRNSKKQAVWQYTRTLGCLVGCGGRDCQGVTDKESPVPVDHGNRPNMAKRGNPEITEEGREQQRFRKECDRECRLTRLDNEKQKRNKG